MNVFAIGAEFDYRIAYQLAQTVIRHLATTVGFKHRHVSLSGIADAAVVGVDHRELGQEVKAYVVLAPDVVLTEADVREWVAQALAPYKVPAYVEFRAELPYTATGKVMKHEL
jgi:acyl-coenzyme A synthetase/AMP-(fatty) acid ligase